MKLLHWCTNSAYVNKRICRNGKLLYFLSSRRAKLFSFFLLWPLPSLSSPVLHTCVIPLVKWEQRLVIYYLFILHYLSTTILLFFRAIAVIDFLIIRYPTIFDKIVGYRIYTLSRTRESAINSAMFCVLSNTRRLTRKTVFRLPC